MNITLRRGASAGIERIPAWLLAALFWAFTFSLFAYRASGQFADFEFFSVQRIGVTLVGAVIFGWVVSSLIRASGPEKSKPLAVLATILPASIAVLAARLLLDITAEDGITNFQEDMRWVLVWAGYFGLWVSAALALHVSRLGTSAGSAPAAPVTVRAKRDRSFASSLAAGQTIEEIAAMLASLPAEVRAEVIRRVDSRQPYEAADPLDMFTGELRR
jgi:hypothetical protein